MSDLEVIKAVCSLVQSIALLICAVMLYFTGKKLLAAWREMNIELCNLRGLMVGVTQQSVQGAARHLRTDDTDPSRDCAGNYSPIAADTRV